MANAPNQLPELSASDTSLHRFDRTPPGGRWAPRFYPWRYALLAGYILVLAGVYCVLSIEEPLKLSLPWQFLVGGSVAFYGLQAAFLTGAPHWRWPRPTGRRPMWVSLIAGGFAASFLTFGFAGTFVSLFRGGQAVGKAVEQFNQGIGARTSDFPWAFAFFVAAMWAVWLLFFALVWASKPSSAFRRVYRLLLAGSFLELLITVPVDVHVRKRTSCYCGEGTFVGLIVGITMAAWAFGPGLALLFLTRRLERRREFQVCVGCGYDLRRLPESRCPECGRPFQPQAFAGDHEPAPDAGEGSLTR